MHFDIIFEGEILFCNLYRLLMVTPDSYWDSYCLLKFFLANTFETFRFDSVRDLLSSSNFYFFSKVYRPFSIY